MPRRFNKPLAVLASVMAFVLVSFFMAVPASSQPPAEDCNLDTIGVIEYADDMWWECQCWIDDPFDPLAPGEEVCEWLSEDQIPIKQRGKNRWTRNSPTNSLILVSSTIVHHIGGAGNFGQVNARIFGTGGNRISRPIGARVIVGRWNGAAWQACHDSNWHYAASNRSAFEWREPANCGAGKYRAQSAGRYWSYSLNRWLTTGWVITETLCVPESCGL
jgi:hypothetical protein